MSLPSSKSVDDPAINGRDHRNSRKEAFLVGSTGEPLPVLGRVHCIEGCSGQVIPGKTSGTLRFDIGTAKMILQRLVFVMDAYLFPPELAVDCFCISFETAKPKGKGRLGGY